MAQKRLVLFVGAGASRACGYPTTADILPEIFRCLEEGAFGKGQRLEDEHIQAQAAPLLAVLRHLVPEQPGGHMPQITEILSVLDYCLESGEELFSSRRMSLKLSEARWLLERAMARVIRKKFKRDTKPRELVEWIKRQERLGKQVTLISTNYDFSLDRYLFDGLADWSVDYLKTDFGFTWRDPDNGELVHPSANAKLRLYKLHGSLNWLGCNRCGNIYVNFLRTLVTLADGNNKWSECHCGYEPLRAVLVAPSFVRRYRDRNLLSVWRSAGEALRLANEWVFIGYSLPTEDIGIRALLLRALLSRNRPPKAHVVSASDDALPRYRQLIPTCTYAGTGLRTFLDAKNAKRR